jgi:hypothetical protein
LHHEERVPGGVVGLLEVEDLIDMVVDGEELESGGGEASVWGIIMGLGEGVGLVGGTRDGGEAHGGDPV